MNSNCSKHLAGLAVGFICFGIGLFLIPNHLPENDERNITERAANQPTATTADEVDLVDNIGCMGDGEDDPRYGPIQISHDRILTTICGSLYVRDSNRNVIWQRLNLAPLTDAPKVVGDELIVIGQDLMLLALDKRTGESKWQHHANGRASYIQLVKYDDERFLVLVDMSMYDDKFVVCGEKHNYVYDRCKRSGTDKLWLFRGKEILDIREDIPPGTMVKIIGRSVFAVSGSGKNKKTRKIAFE